jgi:hypothetical protein
VMDALKTEGDGVITSNSAMGCPVMVDGWRRRWEWGVIARKRMAGVAGRDEKEHRGQERCAKISGCGWYGHPISCQGREGARGTAT